MTSSGTLSFQMSVTGNCGNYGQAARLQLQPPAAKCRGTQRWVGKQQPTAASPSSCTLHVNLEQAPCGERWL